MCGQTDEVLRLDTHPLAEAIADIIIDDLDDLYGERVLRAQAGPEGPQRDAAHAASSIAYLSTRLLRQILRYHRSVALFHEEQAGAEADDRDEVDPDAIW